MPKPAVVFPPTSTAQLLRGVDLLADLLALTLGPTQGVVLHTTELKPKPEVLTDAATLARRITDVPDPEQNIGVMLLRNMVWRMHERVGDGGALTAVLAQAILKRGQRLALAGANRAMLAEGIRRSAAAAVEQLRRLSRPVRGEDDLFAVAYSATGQEELSWALGEMFDLLGSAAHITVEDYVAPYLERVYLDGGRWLGALASPYLVNAPARRGAVYTDCRLALYDGSLTAVDEAAALLELAASDPAPLLLVAHKVTGEALAALTGAHQGQAVKVAAVNLKRAGDKAHSDLADLAFLTGATLISPLLGRRLAGIQAGDLGWARRIDAGPDDLLVAGGRGEPAIIRREIENLSARLKALPFDDDGRPELEMRLGRISGSAGIIKIGALTQAEREFLHAKCEQGIKVLQAAVNDGVLPGGGSAFLGCIPAVEHCAADPQLDPDARRGAEALAHALAAPFERILRNGGIQTPGVYREKLQRLPFGYTFDSVQREVVEAEEAGLLDAAGVLIAALETAVSGAAIALTTETVVLKRKPRISYEP